jgi:hypothetical protein
MVFLLHKCELDGMGTLAASAVVSRVLGDLFHGAPIANGLYKVEVSRLMLLDAPLHFPNYKYDPLQLLLKQVQGQFTLWDNAMMQKAN